MMPLEATAIRPLRAGRRTEIGDAHVNRAPIDSRTTCLVSLECGDARIVLVGPAMVAVHGRDRFYGLGPVNGIDRAPAHQHTNSDQLQHAIDDSDGHGSCQVGRRT